MNEKINQFLDSVCGYVRCKSVHQDIRDELTNHINELKEKYLQEGQNEETAIETAISAMGDGEKIGRRLDRQHRPQTEWSLIGLTAVIVIIGGIVMFISSQFETYQTIDFKRYLIYAVIGIAITVALYFFDYTKLKKFAWPIYLLTLAILIMTIINGTIIDGASRFITIGGLTISTAFTSLLFIVSFASFIEKARGGGNLSIFMLFILAAISVLPILAQPDLAQAVILSFGYFILILSAIIKKHFGMNRKHQLIILGSASLLICVMFVVSVFSAPYRMARIFTFLALAKITGGQIDQAGAMYTQIMANKWLAVSNLFGAATEKVDGYGLNGNMPNVTTDFVLINVIASLGWVVGIILLLSIAVYICRMFIMTKKIKNSFGFFIALGACTILAVQFVTGILVNFGLFPLMSIAIPFISYGGTDYIVSMAMVGLILSVWRMNNPAAVFAKKYQQQ